VLKGNNNPLPTRSSVDAPQLIPSDTVEPPSVTEGMGWLKYVFILIGTAVIVYLLYRIGKVIYQKYKDHLSLKALEEDVSNILHLHPPQQEEETPSATLTSSEQNQPSDDINTVDIPAEPTTTTDAEKCSNTQEVFNISNNVFTYDDAKAVCQAVGARLATLDEVKEAYRKGADWCNYGWTQGQMAVYPTQKETWDKLQEGPAERRKDCGVPGINGGYFDNKYLRFGVNCYGVKRLPTENERNLNIFNPDYVSTEERKLQEKIEKYKLQMTDINFMPFNRNDWVQGGSSDKLCTINK